MSPARRLAPLLLAIALALPAVAPAEPPPPPTPNDTLVSPQVDHGRATFRLYAPEAKTVGLDAEMLPWGARFDLTRGADGVWSGTTEAAPGTYRYVFKVDGVAVVDPRNPEVSPTHTTVRSLVHVDGEALQDDHGVPHGAVAEVWYPSAEFGGPRRMRVYTPPGYDAREARTYPVLYLLHGGGDADTSWPTVGRAGLILDNLIAAGKARPMIVVMPQGHVPGSDGTPRGLPGMGGDPAADPFVRDMLGGIIPYVDRSYRVAPGPQNRAIAGLSMGGIQSANLGLTHPELFDYVAIFSSGWFDGAREQFEKLHGADLDRDRTQLKLLWIAYGRDDPLVHANAPRMLELFDRHGLKYQLTVSDGAHTWTNWRRYLGQLAPLLFR